MYDGTSAYSMDRYYEYTKETQKRYEDKKIQREKESAKLNKKAFICISLVFTLAISFLFLNVILIQTSSKNSELLKELEDVNVRNTQVAFEIASSIDLAEVELRAKTKFGMQHPESHQNVYVDVKQSDYMETTNSDHSPSQSTLDNVIMSLKSFLAYIG